MNEKLSLYYILRLRYLGMGVHCATVWSGRVGRKSEKGMLFRSIGSEIK